MATGTAMAMVMVRKQDDGRAHQRQNGSVSMVGANSPSGDTVQGRLDDVRLYVVDVDDDTICGHAWP